MLRIGFSGTNWTGKSESLYRFINESPHDNIEIVSLSKLVGLCPYPMIQEQTLEGSRWMVDQVAKILENPKHEIQIFDRTPLDILAFTLYAFYQTKEQDVNLIHEILGLIKYFDTIFYVQPSNEWPVNGNEAEDKVRFALTMDFFMREAIKHLEIEVVSLPWNLSVRQELLAEIFSELQTNLELSHA